jgi:hypothetical protein
LRAPCRPGAGCAEDVQDDEQPDALDLELLFDAQGIANDHLEANVQAVAIELDDIERLCGHRCRRNMRQALETRGTRQVRAALKLRRNSQRSADDNERMPICSALKG